MSDSILTSTKKILGISETYTAFDLDVITHINSVFSTLDQLGIGPEGGLAITDETTTWDALVNDDRLNNVRTYVYLRVRMVFDPPQTSFHLKAMQDQISELEWRLNAVHEHDTYAAELAAEGA